MRGSLQVRSTPSGTGPGAVGTRAPAALERVQTDPPCTQVQTLGFPLGPSVPIHVLSLRLADLVPVPQYRRLDYFHLDSS